MIKPFHKSLQEISALFYITDYLLHSIRNFIPNDNFLQVFSYFLSCDGSKLISSDVSFSLPLK